jgi:hypothetical protein
MSREFSICMIGQCIVARRGREIVRVGDEITACEIVADLEHEASVHRAAQHTAMVRRRASVRPSSVARAEFGGGGVTNGQAAQL